MIDPRNHIRPDGVYFWDPKDQYSARFDGPTVIDSDGSESYYFKSESGLNVSLALIWSSGKIEHLIRRLAPTGTETIGQWEARSAGNEPSGTHKLRVPDLDR